MNTNQNMNKKQNKPQDDMQKKYAIGTEYSSGSEYLKGDHEETSTVSASAKQAIGAIREGIKKAQSLISSSENDETIIKLRDLIESVEDTLETFGTEQNMVSENDVDRFNDQSEKDMYSKGLYQNQKSYGSNDPTTSKTDQSDVGSMENQYGKQTR